MGLDTILALMPDRADLQIRFLDAKGRFGFGELNVGAPQLFRRPIGDIATQYIAAFPQSCPLLPGLRSRPAQLCQPGSVLLHAYFKQSRRPRVPAQQAPHTGSDSRRLLFALATTFGNLAQPRFDPFL